MLKIAFEYLTDSYTLLEKPLHNYIIMAFVGAIAYMIAYNIVGWFYHTDLIDGYMSGHILHWIIRLIVFVAVYYAIATSIRVYRWIKSVPSYVWWIVLGIVVGMIIVFILIKIIRWRQEQAVKNKQAQRNVQ